MYSSFQYIPLGNTHQYNIWAVESKIHTISPSIEGLPNPPFMDHHCPHFIRRFGKTMEDVYPTESKITTATKFSGNETTSSKLSTLSIIGRVSKLGQHLYILQTPHPDSNPTTEDRTFFQCHVTFQQMHKEKPLTFPRGCPQLAHWNSHKQRCKGHQEKSQPANWNTDPTTGNIGPCHLHTKCHQVCSASQQTTYQYSHGSSWKDTQWHHHTLQHHKFNIYHHKLSTEISFTFAPFLLMSGIFCTTWDR